MMDTLCPKDFILERPEGRWDAQMVDLEYRIDDLPGLLASPGDKSTTRKPIYYNHLRQEAVAVL